MEKVFFSFAERFNTNLECICRLQWVTCRLFWLFPYMCDQWELKKYLVNNPCHLSILANVGIFPRAWKGKSSPSPPGTNSSLTVKTSNGQDAVNIPYVNQYTFWFQFMLQNLYLFLWTQGINSFRHWLLCCLSVFYSVIVNINFQYCCRSMYKPSCECRRMNH